MSTNSENSNTKSIIERLRKAQVEKDVTFMSDDEDLQFDTSVVQIDIDLLEDAPEEWNFFKKISDDKHQLIKESIAKDGLLHPIYVWQKENRYIILSGHNRKRVFEELYKETNDSKYKQISATVVKSVDMTTERARAIVSIGNLAQRSLNTQEEYQAYKNIYLYNKNELDIENSIENYKKIEETTDKSLRTIRRILNIGKLIPEIRSIVGGSNPINIIAADRLSSFSKDNQEWLYKNYKDLLNSKNIKKLNSNMHKPQMKKIFEGIKNSENIEKAHYILPKDLNNSIMELLKKWEEENDIKWKY